ncbi:complement C1q-like protein 4 [Dreissena polymorpha]|uniref:C1q domain-containing protein n=1 Tax=Dreissena polymorpha TaxID=45954 RepID=A0A9D4C8P1_DREPO|nr:complement C1q-like protein 4 [Dreissena polymorpha]KAH3719009.1 hypothetical protein DPMN_061837 [Dreissena polymorpha]
MLLLLITVIATYSSVTCKMTSDDIERTLSALAEKNEALEYGLNTLRNELELERQHNERLRNEMMSMADQLKKHDTLVNSMNMSSIKRQLTDVTVAFTATIRPPNLTGLNSGQPIIFDRVITNSGTAYDSGTGIFTAPVRGYYVFHMDILMEPGENEYLQFVKDGAHILYNFIQATGSLNDVSGSRTVVVELERGNKVWIRTVTSGHHGSGTLHGNEFSTFSGWLVAVNE